MSSCSPDPTHSLPFVPLAHLSPFPAMSPPEGVLSNPLLTPIPSAPATARSSASCCLDHPSIQLTCMSPQGLCPMSCRSSDTGGRQTSHHSSLHHKTPDRDSPRLNVTLSCGRCVCVCVSGPLLQTLLPPPGFPASVLPATAFCPFCFSPSQLS